METIRALLVSLRDDERAVIMGEYSLLLTLVAVATIVALTSVRDEITRTFFDSAANLVVRR